MCKCMYVHVYMFFPQGTIRQTFMTTPLVISLVIISMHILKKHKQKIYIK